MSKLFPRLVLVAVFSASAALAHAQAVARGGGGGSSSSSGGGGSSSSGGGGGSSSSSGSSGGGGGSTYSAPSHSSAPVRTPSHSGGSNGSAGSSGSSASISRGSGSGYPGVASVRRPDGGSTSAATVPTYSRPNATNIVGYAVPRNPNSRPPVYVYPPYYSYNPWAFGFFGYGYGLSYFYDPFFSPFYGWGYPGYGYGYGYGPGYYGYGYDPWSSYGSGGYDTPSSSYEKPTGQLRIKVKPREARVLVDGAFVGTVDDFNGFFRKLTLPEGRHQITLQRDGYETLTFDVMIISGETINYKGEMHKLTP